MRRLTDVGRELADAVVSQMRDGLDRSEFIQARAAEYMKLAGQPRI